MKVYELIALLEQCPPGDEVCSVSRIGTAVQMAVVVEVIQEAGAVAIMAGGWDEDHEESR